MYIMYLAWKAHVYFIFSVVQPKSDEAETAFFLSPGNVQWWIMMKENYCDNILYFTYIAVVRYDL